MTEEKTNAPEISVSELAGALKRTIEDAFGFVRLRGEISGYRGPVASGHAYFSIKDANTKIDAVIWKGVFGRLKTRPEEGLEVIATGKVTTFPGKSSYQIVIDSLEPAGVGALMALLEERKRRFAAEGLFDPARKQVLPYLPDVIGVVTSPTGAVIRDILHRLADRFPRQVLVWPVRVQGEASAAEVAAAIHGFNSIEPGGPIPRPDVLIVARGGGSLEDLWSFNEEIVVRAAAMSEIPLVAAVGHETDWTLIDLVADMRAPTPTAAAEMVVPVRLELVATTRDLGARLAGGLARGLDRRRMELRGLVRALPGTEALLAAPRQRLDISGLRLTGAMRGGLERRRSLLSQISRRLMAQTPQARLARFSERLSGLGSRLATAERNTTAARHQRLDAVSKRLGSAFAARVMLARHEMLRNRERVTLAAERLRIVLPKKLEERSLRIAGLSALLNSFSYRHVLARGFALVKDASGKPVRSIHAIQIGERLDLHLTDGALPVIVGEGSQPSHPPQTEAAKSKNIRVKVVKPASDQGSLF